jgi:hypothetical protein
MSKNKRSNPKSVIVFDLIWFLFMVSLLAFIYFVANEGNLRREVNVQDLSLCSAPDMNSALSEKILKSDFNHLYVCAKLVSNLSKVPLGIFIYKDSITRPIFTNEIARGPYSPGFFYFEIPFDDEERAGSYRVDIWFGHNIIATTDFQIVDR